MKIVKQFKDPEFWEKLVLQYPKDPDAPADLPPYYWTWGLGDNGKLYCQSNWFVDHGEFWHTMGYCPTAASILSIRDMKRLIKEFGHLLVFL